MIGVLSRVLKVFATFLDIFAGALHGVTTGIGKETQEHKHAEHKMLFHTSTASAHQMPGFASGI